MTDEILLLVDLTGLAVFVALMLAAGRLLRDEFDEPR